jgi:hypothetical protein
MPSKKKTISKRKVSKKVSKRKNVKKSIKRWRDQVPMAHKKRLAKAKIAPHCFLDLSDANHPKYPICKSKSSKISCQGLVAAKKRATLQRNETIKRRATNLQKDLCK